ncbi:unnamed protein product [Heterobilharzia americana]|nr:unnamed protein product [Heterobilharzia americana]
MYANSQLEKAVEEFCHIVVQTLARGGNVLVPSNPCGIIFDLLETAIRAKDNFSGNILPLFPHDQPTVNKNNHINHNNNSNNDAGNPTNMVTTTVNSQSNNKTTFNSATPSNMDSIVVNNYAQSAIRNSSITSSGGSSSSGRVARSPVFILSNQVHVSLAYSNAYGEWLNAAKEAVLYTADSPFPFQSLLQSGELVALKSLYDSSSSKKLLSDSSSGVYSSRILTSPLLLGPANSSSSGGYFETGGSNSSNPISTTAAANLDPAILALTTSTVRDSSSNNHNVSGGIWPNSPCLIFASHPSLRLGPSVHLTRALAYGSLRSGNRSSIPSHHSVILIESGDYVPSYECNSKLLCSPETHLRRVITPFLQSENISANRTTFSQSGTPALSISDTATVYWLPMEARIGVNQINQLVKRCGEPRLALILPQEVCDQPMILTNITATSEQLTTKIHGISYSQQLCLSLPDSRLQQVRVSSKLVSTIKPVYITLQSENFNSITNSSVDKTSDNKKQVNSTQNEMDYHHSSGKSELKRKLSSTPPRTPPPVVTSTSSDNMSKELSGVIEKQSSDEAAGQDKRTCIALVNGLLTTRDGKHWLIGKEERLEPDSTQPVKDFLRPSTPPPPALSTMTTTTPNHSANGPAKDRNQKFNLNTKVNIEHRVLVNCNSHSPRINPCELIQKLTERGVTGAYLADPLTARQMYARYAMYNSKHCDSINNEDVILFPNPNTMICLTDHGSHIIAMDESTRTTIRDTILPFLQYLETRSTVQL